jgi:hypothetical protein
MLELFPLGCHDVCCICVCVWKATQNKSKANIQSPLVYADLAYPALVQIRSVDSELRPRPNDFSA